MSLPIESTEVDQPQPLLDTAAESNQNYVTRLKSEIEQTKIYIKQADIALATFADTSNGQSVTASSETYSKIPYVPSKDDVIDTTITSQKLQLNLDRQTKYIEHFKSSISQTEEDLVLLGESIKDYQEILSHTESLHEEPVAIPRLSRLNHHLEVIVEQYLQLSELNHDRKAVEENIELIKSLLKSSSQKDPWVEVVPSVNNDKFIKSLVMKNVFISRDDSDMDGYFIRIRELV